MKGPQYRQASEETASEAAPEEKHATKGTVPTSTPDVIQRLSLISDTEHPDIVFV